MIAHDDLHADPAELGPPLARGWLEVQADGQRVEVAVWAPVAEPWEVSTWRGWLLIEGHPDFDPPGRILGGTPFQPILVAFDVIARWARDKGAFPVEGP